MEAVNVAQPPRLIAYFLSQGARFYKSIFKGGHVWHGSRLAPPEQVEGRSRRWCTLGELDRGESRRMPLHPLFLFLFADLGGQHWIWLESGKSGIDAADSERDDGAHVDGQLAQLGLTTSLIGLASFFIF